MPKWRHDSHGVIFYMNIVRESQTIFRIRDLNQGAFLLTLQYEMLGISWTGRVAWWRFSDHDGRIEEKLQEFINGRATGNINQFANAQRVLKQTLLEN